MNGASIKQSLPAFARVVLIRGESSFTLDDIVSHGWFLGELRTPWSELMSGLACAEAAAESDLAPEDEALNSMSEEFRYARDLLTVEETERWLLARDLTEEGFTEYLLRRYWQSNPPETAIALESDYLTASAELRELLRSDLLFSGKFEDLTRAVSWRLSAGVETTDSQADPDVIQDERVRFFERTDLDEISLPEALQKLNRTPGWLEECLRVEVCYRQTCESLLSDQARARTLATMRLPLTRIKMQMLTLRSLEAAQEAFLCLTKDHLPPAQLARECGVCWEEQELFLEDLPPDVQQEFLSAGPGEVLAPEAAQEGFVLTRIVAKTEPVLLNDQVHTRIDQQLLKAHFSELSGKHIRWVLGGPAHE